MHPYIHAGATPDKAAYIMAADGREVSYRELNEWSNRLAHVWRSVGLECGDVIAVLLENNVSYFPIVWAAQRAGLTYTCLSPTLSPGDLAFIIRDSGSKAVIASRQTAPLLERAKPELAGLRYFQVGGTPMENEDLDAAAAGASAMRIADETSGIDMLYSSGTTGRPKGVRRPIPPNTPVEQAPALVGVASTVYRFDGDTVYLSPAPLYHAAPLRWAMAVQRLGGTVIVMDKFDAERALALIAAFHVTAAQWVPTHFSRLLQLPPEVRGRYDTSSLRTVFHAAAPCPVNVKDRMLDWWGPIVHEYYAGTESNGMTMIAPEEWLAHRGSVGRAVVGEIKICGEDGEPLSPRREGGVYFAGGESFEYHNDAVKTDASRNQYGWTTLGDVGWVDEEGYLYLTDRKHFMIISGGVNIYPQEIENSLINHPAVADVAVIGAPDDDMGEKVVAVVELVEWEKASDALAAELRAYAREHLGGVKAPKQIDFVRELPRQPTGKLFKRLLREAYWPARNAAAPSSPVERE